MSSKKARFSSKVKDYMKIAINLARSRKGLTGDNPSVGCLIVKDDKIISIGRTGYNGRPHAEHNAIKNSSEKLQGSRVTYIFEPFNFSNEFFIALCSACGLPLYPVWPIEIILSFFTIKQPTDGLSPVKPLRDLAKLIASFM